MEDWKLDTVNGELGLEDWKKRAVIERWRIMIGHS